MSYHFAMEQVWIAVHAANGGKMNRLQRYILIVAYVMLVCAAAGVIFGVPRSCSRIAAWTILLIGPATAILFFAGSLFPHREDSDWDNRDG